VPAISSGNEIEKQRQYWERPRKRHDFRCCQGSDFRKRDRLCTVASCFQFSGGALCLTANVGLGLRLAQVKESDSK
jgi:hypothetical protein